MTRNDKLDLIWINVYSAEWQRIRQIPRICQDADRLAIEEANDARSNAAKYFKETKSVNTDPFYDDDDIDFE